MPSFESYTPTKPKECSFKYLRLYFPVSTLNQLQSHLTSSFFGRYLNKFAAIKISLPPQKVCFNTKACLFKRQLVEDLAKRGITYDQYRSGMVGNINIVHLKQRFELPQHSEVYIHEGDFPRFQSEALKIFEPFMVEPAPFVYEYYDCSTKIDRYDSFLTQFRHDLNKAMTAKCAIDTRMVYDQVFDNRSNKQ